jgi:hypothetical protein
MMYPEGFVYGGFFFKISDILYLLAQKTVKVFIMHQ